MVSVAVGNDSDIEGDRLEELIAAEERKFLRRQPRSTDMIAKAREYLAGGAT